MSEKVGRSLKATKAGIVEANSALITKKWTQEKLAEEVACERQTVNKFFACKAIDRQIFVEICEALGFGGEGWKGIADLPKAVAQTNGADINALVQESREKIRDNILQRCGTMRVLDMSHPIGLNDIYTNVNILEKITGRRRKEIDELLQECKSENFERFGLGRITEERVPGLEAVQRHSKLMVLGKPGAGKTTLLKYLAIQCICGKFQANLVPIFIRSSSLLKQTNNQI